MRYTNREFSRREYSVSTFSTTCLPNEHTFVEHVMTTFSLLSYLKSTRKGTLKMNEKFEDVYGWETHWLVTP